MAVHDMAGEHVDHAIDWSSDGGVAEIELGLPLQGGGARGSSYSLRKLGLDQVDLLQRGYQIGLVALDRSFGAGAARLRGLRVLNAAIAGCGEVGVALVLLARECLGGSINLDR